MVSVIEYNIIGFEFLFIALENFGKLDFELLYLLGFLSKVFVNFGNISNFSL